MLTLYQPPRAWGAPNSSPFCTKLETYLRMADIPYQVETSVRRAPKGKVPFVRFEGRMLSDSSRIISLLKTQLGDTVDGHLTPHEQALGRLCQRTLEEGTYWSLLYDRWVPDDHFELVRNTLFSDWTGRALRLIVPDLTRKRVLTMLFAQGISRHDREWVYDAAARDVSAVSDVLGGRPYLFGDTPCSFDAVLYAFSSAIWKTPFAHRFAAPPENVRAHLERMHRRYFPELVGEA
jgi:glutathione S-transferase